MAKIRILSDHVANQIAAGEVVERPASVVKELVENSLDAGARSVRIDVEAGGRRLLRIVDDGEGMTRDDAVLAFERHATSKLQSESDLSRIATLGFRGEALASIAAVARVDLATCNLDSGSGTRVVIEGGRLLDVKDAAHPAGTTVIVRDLFFNTPARRKFLRSEATESYHLANLATQFALAHPQVAFTLRNNGREVLRVAAAQDVRERIFQVFGAVFLDNLLAVRFGLDQLIKVSGYISAPTERRMSRDSQYIFVNGRFVKDKLLGRAVSAGYGSILPKGVYPAAIVYLEVPAEDVDVNVHPAKTEVRFRRAVAVSDAVCSAIQASVEQGSYHRLSAITEQPTQPQVSSGAAGSVPDSGARAALVQAEPTVGAQQTANVAEPMHLTASTTAGPAQVQAAALTGRLAFAAQSSAAQHEVVAEQSDPFLLRRAAAQAGAVGEHSIESPELAEIVKIDARAGAEADAELAVLSGLTSIAGLVRDTHSGKAISARPLGQFGGRYIVAVDREGLLLIDQHLAHERVLYERMRAGADARRVPVQNLLTPQTIDLSPAQAQIFEALADELEQFGFGLMKLSGRTIAVKSMPVDLESDRVIEVLLELLSSSNEDGERARGSSELRDRIAFKLACSAAVHAGDLLTEAEMVWLVDSLARSGPQAVSPHGRPMVLRLATRDLERAFQRG